MRRLTRLLISGKEIASTSSDLDDQVASRIERDRGVGRDEAGGVVFLDDDRPGTLGREIGAP